jgi:hypothetical protein
VEQAAHIVIGRGFDVFNRLGAGFVEKVYENTSTREIQHRDPALFLELNFTGLRLRIRRIVNNHELN